MDAIKIEVNQNSENDLSNNEKPPKYIHFNEFLNESSKEDSRSNSLTKKHNIRTQEYTHNIIYRNEDDNNPQPESTINNELLNFHPNMTSLSSKVKNSENLGFKNQRVDTDPKEVDPESYLFDFINSMEPLDENF